MRWPLIPFFGSIVLFFDQYTKFYIEKTRPLYSSLPITDFFNITHIRNTGAAFGLLADPDTTWQLWFFLGTVFVALVLIFILAKSSTTKARSFFIALGAISGGALGNAVDRVRLGEVIDFLDVHYLNYHWPAFNIADIGICCGAFVVMFYMLKNSSKPQEL